MVSILDRTLIIDLCIRFIHNYYWFKRGTACYFHVLEGPRKTQRTMTIDSRPTLYSVGTANVHPCAIMKIS